MRWFAGVGACVLWIAGCGGSSTGGGGTDSGLGGAAGSGASSGTAGTGGSGGSGGVGVGGSGGVGVGGTGCNQLVDSAPNPTCSVVGTIPTATGGSIPSGTYHYVSLEAPNCSGLTDIRQTVVISNSGANTYTMQVATEINAGTTDHSTSVATTGGTTLSITHLCPDGTTIEPWSFSVLQAAGKDLLRLTGATVHTYERVGN